MNTDTKTFPRYMMATTAIHKLGNISRDEEDYCFVKEQIGDDYIGSWVEGYGFFGVKFPVETTRELTEEELDFAESRDIVIV